MPHMKRDNTAGLPGAADLSDDTLPAGLDDASCPPPPPPIIINEAQLILAEKRTSLAALRTGITIIALPMTLTTFLIATSRYYDSTDVLHFLLPVGILNFVLLSLGGWLSLRAVGRLRQQERTLQLLKARHDTLAEFLK